MTSTWGGGWGEGQAQPLKWAHVDGGGVSFLWTTTPTKYCGLDLYVVGWLRFNR